MGEVHKANTAEGVQVDPQTLKPLWEGEKFDVGYVIDVLHPLANPPSGPPPDPPASEDETTSAA